MLQVSKTAWHIKAVQCACTAGHLDQPWNKASAFTGDTVAFCRRIHLLGLRRFAFRYKGMLYEYGYEERRLSPRKRTNEFVHAAATFTVQRGVPFLGHKCFPLMSGLPGFDYLRYIPGELQHGM